MNIRIKLRKIFFLLLLFTITTYAQKNQKEINEFIVNIDKKVPELLKQQIVPGASIAIIENGKIILQKSYGFSNLKEKIKVTNTTGFNVASISKTLTAWGVMKLVEQGKINLNSSAEDYLSRWHFSKSKFNSKKITIKKLLSHTAGLSLHGYPGWTTKDSLPTIEESLNGKNNGPGKLEIIFKPGSKWKYSGGGYTVLQLIIEEVTGQKFEDFMQKEILNPLGMHNSSFKISNSILEKSSLEYNSFGEQIDFEVFTAKAAAGLHTTIEDFSKFVIANFYTNNNSNILSVDSLKKMMTTVPISNKNYGLGYQTESYSNLGIKLVGHNGSNSGWASFFRVDPISKDGFLIVTNGRSGKYVYNQLFCDWFYWKTGNSLGEKCQIQSSYASKLKKYENTFIKNDILKKYIGKYDFGNGFIISITLEKNQLYAQATGQHKHKIFPKSRTEFYLKVVEALLVFNTNEVFETRSLTLIQNGKKNTGIKLKT